MFRKFFTVFGTLGILFVGVVFISVMGAMRPQITPEEPEIAPPTVFYMVAAPRSVTLDVTAQGEVRPRTDITLTAQVSGRIVETGPGFVDGGSFDKDELLVKIEDADYRFAVTSARARVAQAEEALRREEAESVLARRDYEELGRDDDPSELALRMPQLAQAKAAFEAAQADYRAAQLNLQRTSIAVPFKGRVRERTTGVGQFVSPGAQLARVFSTDVAEIRLPLTDSDLAKLGVPIGYTESADRPGPEVALSAIVAGEEHQWTGRIARTEGAIDPSTRQVYAVAVVDDPYGAAAMTGAPLAVGLFVDARIQGRPYESAIVLPRSALYGRNTVYVIAEDDTLRERTVSVVAADRDTITISSGVEPGERVATSPLRGAGNGDVVHPTDPDSVGREPSPETGAVAETALGERM